MHKLLYCFRFTRRPLTNLFLQRQRRRVHWGAWCLFTTRAANELTHIHTRTCAAISRLASSAPVTPAIIISACFGIRGTESLPAHAKSQKKAVKMNTDGHIGLPCPPLHSCSKERSSRKEARCTACVSPTYKELASRRIARHSDRILLRTHIARSKAAVAVNSRGRSWGPIAAPSPLTVLA